MNKIEHLRKRRQQAHRQLLDMKSKVYEAFLKMEAATYTDGALPKKTKELIAIGISVAIDCESCMEWHITQAARDSASLRCAPRGQRLTGKDLAENSQPS